MGIEWIKENIDPAWGNWFAGFVDGEGCFLIKPSGKHGYKAVLDISLRDDDDKILKEIQEKLGGNLCYHKVSNPNSKPAVTWRIQRAGHVVERLVSLFRLYPLRSSKRRDFEIWAMAAELHHLKLAQRGQGKWPSWYIKRMKSLKEALHKSKRYQDDIAIPDIQVPQKRLF